MFKHVSFLLLVFVSFNVYSQVEIPQTVQDQIVADVIADKGYIDTAEVDARIRLWKIEQPPSAASGEMIESGSCQNDCVQSGGNDSLPKPRNVKIKGKKIGDDFTQNFVVKWKRPKALPSGSPYKLKNYRVILSKNGKTYKKYKVKAEFKNNGSPKKHQRLKLRNLDVAVYTVQVRARYKESTSNKNATLSKSSELSSKWTDSQSGKTKQDPAMLSSISGSQIVICEFSIDGMPIQGGKDYELSLITGADCSDAGIQDIHLSQMHFFVPNLRSLNLSNNPAITNISGLRQLNYLEWLRLDFNTGLDMTLPQNDLSVFDSLETLYLKGLNLLEIPALPENVTYLNLSKNKISNNAGGFWPRDPLSTLVINNNATSFNDKFDVTGTYTLTDQFVGQMVLLNMQLETLQIRNSLFTEADGFSFVSGLNLKSLDLKGDHLKKHLDYSTWNQGLCFMNLESNNIETISGYTPIQSLSLVNNNNLKKVELLTDPNHKPAYIGLTGSDALLCTEHNKISDSTAAAILDMSGVPGSGNIACPLWQIPPKLDESDSCKPDPLQSLSAYKNTASNWSTVTWDESTDPLVDYQRWGVTKHRVDFYQNDVLLGSVDQALGANYATSEFVGADKVTVSACVGEYCGYEIDTSQIEEGGLGTVSALDEEWTIPAQDSFKIKFTYNQTDFTQPLGQPEHFEVTPLVNGQPSKSPLIINVDGSYQSEWSTSMLDRTTYSEVLFSVRACRVDVGCGAVTYIDVQNPDPYVPTVNSFEVYEDSDTQRRYLTWEIDEQLTGVTHYLIRAKRLTDILNEYTVSADDPDYLILNGTFPTKYDITACIDANCGVSLEDSISFDQGLYMPLSLGASWSPDKNHFSIRFNYPNWQDLGLASAPKEPEYFEIRSDFPQNDGTFLLATVNWISGAYQSGWESPLIDRTNTLGTSFNVRACRSDMGCSHYASIAVNEPVMGDLELPNVIGLSATVDLTDKSILLNWSYDNSADEALALIDYLKITEKQPKRREDTLVNYGLATQQGDELVYYSHQIEAKTMKLSRFTNGYYDYTVSACYRNESDDEVCSNSATFAGGVNEVTAQFENPTVAVSMLEITDVSAEAGYLCMDERGCQNGSPNHGDRTPVENITWQMPVRNDGFKPDYFLLKSKPGYGTGQTSLNQPVCNSVVVDENSGGLITKPVYEIRVDVKSIKTEGASTTTWTTKGICEDLYIKNQTVVPDPRPVNGPRAGKWLVSACVNGVGCGNPFTYVCDENESVCYNQSASSVTNDSNNRFSSVDPGSLQPGSFWNKSLAGTGWHLYWVNGLNQTAQDGRYGRAYDMVGYWFSYQQVDEKWIPVWYEARLRQQPGLIEGRAYLQGNLYIHKRTSSPGEPIEISEIDTGNIQLLIHENASCTPAPCEDTSQHATMILDLDYEKNFFTPPGDSDNVFPYTREEDGALRLEIKDIAIDLFNSNRYKAFNDNDHYQGLWQRNIFNPDNNPMASAEMSMLNWINGGLENDLFVYFDGSGNPVWLASQTCPQMNVTEGFCLNASSEVPPATYFDEFLAESGRTLVMMRFGYNPLMQKPMDWLLEVSRVYVGDFGREFETSDTDTEFRKAKFWLNVDRDIDGRQITINDMGTDQASMLELEKRANLHGIFYDIEPITDISVNTCDPNVVGSCLVLLNWYTDDKFPSIAPYVIKNGANAIRLQDYITANPDEIECDDSSVPTNVYSKSGFRCEFKTAANYVFQLHKDKYESSGTEVIAQSQTLFIKGCHSGNCGAGYQPAYAATVNPAQHTLNSDNSSSLVGFTSGQMAVDMSGAATYSVPIFAPAGTGGLSPSLALAYHSHGTNDIAGVGWGIAGTSSISRCLRNAEQDGIGLDEYKPITLTNEDAFCLDGQKLLQVPSSTISHGENGAEYRTEIEGFSRIKVVGQSLGGPDTFEVRLKNGEIRTYGSSSTDFNAQVKSADGSAVVSWLLNKIADRHGNEIWFVWDTSKIGETYLQKVEYTHNSSFINPQNVITFNYEERPDQNMGYANKIVNKNHQRLKSISTQRRKTLAGSLQTIRKLDLTYIQSPLSGLSLISAITECVDAASSQCLQPVRFDWSSDGSEDWFRPLDSNRPSYSDIGRMNQNIGSLKPIDLNGDGASEFVFPFYKENGGVNPEFRFALAGNSDLIDIKGSATLGHPHNNEYCSENLNGFYNRTCNTDIQPAEPEKNSINDNDYYVYDFNGDGFDDLLSPVKEQGSSNLSYWTISYSDGERLCQFASDGADCRDQEKLGVRWHENAHAQTFADFTGDGVPDLLAFDVVSDVVGLKPYTSLGANAYLHVTEYDDSLDSMAFNGNTQIAQVKLDLGQIPLHDYEILCADLTTPPAGLPQYIECSETEFTGMKLLSKVDAISPLASDFNGDGLSDLLVTYKYVISDTTQEGEQPSSDTTDSDGNRWIKIWAVHSYVPTSSPTGELAGELKLIQNIGMATGFGPIWVSGDGGLTVNEFSDPDLIEFGPNEALSVIDVNGDYLADLVSSKGVFINENGTFGDMVAFNVDDNNLYTQAMAVNADYDQGEMDDDFKYLLQHIDVDFDGDLDVLYPDPETGVGPVNYSYRTLEYSATGGYSYSSRKIPSSSILARKSDSKAAHNTHLFFDLNGDAHIDQLHIKRGTNNDDERREQFANDDWKARDKIIAIRKTEPTGNGLVDEIRFTYESATLPTVYARETDGYKITDWGNGSAVLDMKTPMYLVRRVDQKSPLKNTSENFASVLYHYKGMKLQGGGRGSLGFAEVSSIDLVNKIGTQTRYRQDFPYTGMPEWTMRSHYAAINPAATELLSCTIGDAACDFNQCMGDDCMDPVIDGLTADSISDSLNEYAEVSQASLADSIYPYLYKSIESQYELDSTEAYAATETVMTYHDVASPAAFYGNIHETYNRTCDGFTEVVNSEGITELQCNKVTEIETVNTYGASQQNVTEWILGRLTRSVVYKRRYDAAGQVSDTLNNTTDFKYDTSTGQLTEEIFNKNKPPAQYLKTTHIYDNYGNETDTLTCSKSVVGAGNCTVAYEPPVVFDNPLDIYRHASVSYDGSWHQYLVSSTSLFGHKDAVKAKRVVTSISSGHDVFGNPAVTTDLLTNVTNSFRYGLLGELQSSKTNTGTYSETFSYWCYENPLLYCPDEAAIVTVTAPEGAPASREYKDMQGRVVRVQTQSMGDAGNPGAWRTVDTYYDEAGRNKETSMPYFISNGGAVLTTIGFNENVYDALGRIRFTKNPSHTGSLAISETRYAGLSTTTFNALNQKEVTIRDVSGQVIEKQQFLDNHKLVYNSITYGYDANDKLLTLTSDGDVTTMTYDRMGRKETMVDPSKGSWAYSYNALGDLTSQSDGLGQVITNTYDIRGRLVEKTAQYLIGEQPLHSIWHYDEGCEANLTSRCGQLSRESTITKDQTDVSGGRERIDRYYSYDGFGRSSEVMTHIFDGERGDDASVYTEETRYDELGRVFQQIDATGFGTMLLYNQYGYQYKIMEAAQCFDLDASGHPINDNNSGTCQLYDDGNYYRPYYEALAMDPYGNVIKESLHGGKLTKVRSHHLENGFLKNTCISRGTQPICHQFDSLDGAGISFTFDQKGNLKSRNDGTNAENYTYDDLNRLEIETRTISGITGNPINYSYAANGNLETKAGHTLSYTGSSPHAVTAFKGTTYVYDAVGNMTMSTHADEDGQNKSIKYTGLNKAYLIENLDNGQSTYFQYDGTHARYVRKDLDHGSTKRTTHYIGHVEMIRTGAYGSPEKYKRYIGDLIIDMPVRLAYPSSWRFNYQLKDHLGSVHTSIELNRAGTGFTDAVVTYSFDAWGKRRSVFNATDHGLNEISILFSTEIERTTRGYTGHEHLDDVGIIHMNGRIYDAELGRFLQADPFIQDPYDTQSLNRYTYVFNNPLSNNDPTGYFSWNVFMKNYGRPLAAIAVSFIPAGQSWAAVLIKGAVSGGITGGSKGALIGAFTAAAFHGIGEGFGGIESTGNFLGSGLGPGQFAAKIAAHGLVGGASSVLQGGKFGHGFASAGATQAFAPAIGHITVGPKNGEFLRITVAAIVGGSISEATGGKFAMGAVTGAFSRAFNDEGHREEDNESKFIIDNDLKHHVQNVFSSSEYAREIRDYLENDDSVFSIEVTSGGGRLGSAKYIQVPDTRGFFERFFSFRTPPPRYYVKIAIDLSVEDPYLFNVKGVKFIPTAERIFGHELGHTYIRFKQGAIASFKNQKGAVAIENKIIKQVNANAEIRHPTMGHGHGF